MYVFRMHIRPKGGTADMRATFDYCYKNGLLGVGWRTNSERNTKNWDEYFNEASLIPEYGKLNVCKYIRKWVAEDSLVWTRDAQGQYYLARVESGWEYWTSPEAKKLDIDVANIFRCVFQKVATDAVPGKIVACFRASRTIQEIADKKAREYSKHLWNTLSKKQVYQIDKSAFSDIFMMLDDEETEDLLFLYLQSQGWYVVPNSRKADTMSFEYFVVKPVSGEMAGAQVKTGETPLCRDNYVDYPHKVFLFQSNERYTGSGAENVVCVSREALLKFLNESLIWLPKYFRTKMEMINQ